MQELAPGHKKAGPCDGCEKTLLSRSTSLQKYPCGFYTFLAGQCEHVGEHAVAGMLVPDNTSGCAVCLVERDQVGVDEDRGLWSSPLEGARKE